jgi:hypothetical protein
MGWIIPLIMFAASLVVGEILRPRPKVENAKPAGLEDLGLPTASPARNIPVAFGTVLTRAANLIWWGDFKATPITEKTGGFFGIGKKSVTLGHKYSLGMDLALCYGPIDALEEILIDEKSVWTGSTNSGEITINKPNFFGGNKSGGGLLFALEIYNGSSTQSRSSYLQSLLTNVPAYRNVCHLVQRGPSGTVNSSITVNLGWFKTNLSGRFSSGYIGETPNLRPYAFKIRRIPNNLGVSGYSNINSGDANPAEVLYEILTNTQWGMSLPVGKIDLGSFQAVAQTLYNEGNGFSYIFNDGQSIESMLNMVLQQIDGLIYIHYSTGKYTLKLARKDYDVNTLTTLDENNSNLIEYSNGSYDETTNEVRVEFTSRVKSFKPDIAFAQDLANYQIQNASVPTEIQYKGVSNASTATNLAMRDLRALTIHPAKCKIEVDRTAGSFMPGQCFKLAWSKLGIVSRIMRVLAVDYGSYSRGTITIDAISDLYALGSNVYAAPGDTGWSNPISDAVPVAFAVTDEQPYWFAQDGQNRLWTIASGSNGSQLDYDTFVSTDGGANYTAKDEHTYFAPTGTLVQDYESSTGYVDTSNTLKVNAGSEMIRLLPYMTADIENGANLFRIDNEILAFDSYTDNGDGTYTFHNVWRGLLDTVPVKHLTGARVWFCSYGQSIPEDTFTNGQSINIKHVTYAPSGQLALDSAAAYSLTFNNRALKPYPPGDVKINSASWPVYITGDCSSSWVHRDRLSQPKVTKQDASSVGPEVGTTYTLRFYGETGSLLRTVSGLTSTSYIYTTAQEITDSGALNRPNEKLKVTIASVVSGRESLQVQIREFEQHGYGMFYGDSYGE